MSAILVLCTCPDDAVAEPHRHARWSKNALPPASTALPGSLSTYRWKDEIHRDSECLLLIKSTSERFAALRERIVALHPYELPEVIAVDIRPRPAAHISRLDCLPKRTAACDASPASLASAAALPTTPATI